MILYAFLDESGFNVNHELRKLGVDPKTNKIHMAFGWQLYLGKVVLKYGSNGLIKPKNKLLKERSRYIGLHDEDRIEIATIKGLKDLLTYLINNKYNNEDITVFMDNKTTVDLINTSELFDNNLKSKLSVFINLKIKWFGRDFNGFADKLAKQVLNKRLDTKLMDKMIYKLKYLTNQLGELKGSKYENKINMLQNEIERLDNLVKEKEQKVCFYDNINSFTYDEYNRVLAENKQLHYELKRRREEKEYYKNTNKNLLEMLQNKKSIIADDSPLNHLLDEEDQPFENL